jgi:hypothetical protein
LNDYFCFFSARYILVLKILTNSFVSSSFPIQHSMLDVRCSTCPQCLETGVGQI